jgi:HAD superfamily hydrolase (TIGR01458 family)
MNSIRAILVDIDGPVTDGVGGPALPGAAAAVHAIAERGPFRFVTNTTSRPRADLVRALGREGFPVGEETIVTPATLARKVLAERGDDRGVLIADPRSLVDLSWYAVTEPDSARSVLLASEAHDLAIGELNPAVAALLRGARLYTLQQNRVFRRGGHLVTDLGPVAAFLGYAGNVAWENLGKPSELLFRTLATELGVEVGDLAMVGDDAEFDASGAIAAGCGAGILVRTGKYRCGDELRVEPRPTLVIDSVADLLTALS